MCIGLIILTVCGVANLVVPALGGLLTMCIGAIIDVMQQKGKVISKYSKRKIEADKIYKNTVKLIDDLDKKISKEKDKSKKDLLINQKKELEKLKRFADELVENTKNEKEYYEKYGFSEKTLKYAIDEIENNVASFKNNKLPFEHYSYIVWQLYYFDLDYNKFKKLLNSNRNNTPQDYPLEFAEEHGYDELVNWLKDKHLFEIVNDGSGNAVLFCQETEKFYYWDHECNENDGQMSINEGRSFEQMKNMYKKFIEKHKEYVQADAELGYYRFSEPPKGEKRKEF